MNSFVLDPLALLPYQPEERPEIINKFISYLRQKNKIILELDRLKYCDKYRRVFTTTYLPKLITNPGKFISYQSGIGFDSEFGGVIRSWQVVSEKFFESYYYVLTNRLLNDTHIVCTWCCTEISKKEFEVLTSVFYRYTNHFRCPGCKNLNWWNDP